MISCIMPTTESRRHFLQIAITYFQRQDFADKELIIIDDSPVPLPGLSSENVRYIHYPEGFPTLGAKRNFACSEAKGDVIFHWDDDDWYAPDWLSTQCGFMAQNEADICGLDQLYFCAPQTRVCWKYSYGYDSKQWVAGATLSYTRKAWLENPFPDMNVGEDNFFVWNAKGKVMPGPYLDGFVSMLHDSNTSPKNVLDSQWKPVPFSTIENILKADIVQYR